MTFQLLISTMNQENHELLDRMNVRSDALVVNQCDRDSLEQFDYHGHTVTWISMSRRGVGLSRNTALANATADVVLFADDDVVYADGYEREVLAAFENNARADVICFNIELINSVKNFGYRNNKRNKRLHLFNSMRYGGCRIAARRKAVQKNRIAFSHLFGGGAEFSSGEDSLFIRDCYKRGLRLYASTYLLGQVDDSSSSWYRGVNDKLFVDKGALLYNGFPVMHRVLFALYAYRMRKRDKNYSFFRILKLFRKGKKVIKQYR